MFRHIPHFFSKTYGSLVATTIGLLFTLVAATAHEQQPAIGDLSFDGNTANLELVLNLEALLAGIGPEHDDTDDAPEAERYNTLRALTPEALEAEFRATSASFLANVKAQIKAKNGEDALPVTLGSLNIVDAANLDLPRETTLFLKSIVPADAEALTLSWAEIYGPMVLRIAPRTEGEEPFAAYIDAGEISPSIPISTPLPQVSAFQAFMDYIPVGFDHIIPKGLDHILFVIGLFLFSTKLKPLLIQVTTFTFAHTITLALASMGIVTISGAIVEPLIALSIAYVAIENIFASKLGASRTLIIFLFGLLHGLGFASVLADFGIGQSNFIASLIGFNIGVEIGQLAVIAACFLAVGFWFGDKPWYRKVVVIPVSILIALIGLYWAFERVFL